MLSRGDGPARRWPYRAPACSPPERYVAAATSSWQRAAGMRFEANPPAPAAPRRRRPPDPMPSRSAAMALRRRIHLVVMPADLPWPLRLDPRQHRDDFLVAQHALVRRHRRIVVLQVRRLGNAELGDTEQQLVGVVPGVPRCVVRRRGQTAGRVAFAPAR